MLKNIDGWQTELNLFSRIFPNQIPLTEPESRLIKQLHYGRENAIYGRDLANILGIKPRAVTDTVKRIRLKYYDIGSNYQDGYYLLKDPQEYTDFRNNYERDLFERNTVYFAINHTPMARELITHSGNSKKVHDKNAQLK